MPKLATDHDFAVLRALLQDSGFTEEEVLRRYGLESLEKFEIAADSGKEVPFDDSAAGVLTRLFVNGRYVDLGLLDRFLGEEALKAMVELDLLETKPDDPTQIAAQIALYPLRGIWLISDRWDRPDRGVFKPGPDIVYPAIIANPQRFLKFLPTMPCGSFLDLCAGSGAAALIAAKHFAGHAVATDIADRSVLFAEFNRRLNGLANAESLGGDLYAPCAGRQFDRIVVHPPYVPVLRPKFIYHDGGDDGEQIIRRCVAEMPSYLAPGGIFYLQAMVTQRDEEAFETRVRNWMGDAHVDFDVAVFPMHTVEADTFASRAVLANPAPAEDFKAFKALFTRLKISGLVYSILLIQRRAEEREVFTIRRQARLSSNPQSIYAALEFETSIRRPGGLAALLDLRFTASKETVLNVPHKLADEGWQPAFYQLSVTEPFAMEAKTEAWGPHLLAYCDGTRTLREALDVLVQVGAMPEGVDPLEFARAASLFISGGFLRPESQS